VRGILLSLLVAGVLVTAPARAGGVAPARILIIGDSVTQGAAGDHTWRYRLWRLLQARRAAVDFVGPRRGEFNAAADPDDYDDVADYPDPDFDQDHAARWGGSMAWRLGDYDIPQLLAGYAPDVVINDEGYNDLTVFKLTPQQLIDLMAQFVADVRAARPTAAIVIGQLPQRWAAGVDEYNALLVDLAAALDTPTSRVLAAPAPQDFTEYVDTYDPAHPSATGELKIAEEFAGALALLPLPTLPAPPVPDTAYAGAGRLSVTARPHSALLGLTAPAGATSQVVWARDLTARGRWHPVARVPASAHHHRVRALHRHHRYAFRVRAYQGDRASTVFSRVVRVRLP